MRLRDLADLLDLSPTTVSRALNGYPEVGATTRARVIAAARETGYRASHGGRALATGRRMAVGAALPAGPPDPALGDLVAGAAEALSSAGHHLAVFAGRLGRRS